MEIIIIIIVIIIIIISHHDHVTECVPAKAWLPVTATGGGIIPTCANSKKGQYSERIISVIIKPIDIIIFDVKSGMC